MEPPLGIVGFLAALTGLIFGPVGLVALIRSLRASRWPRVRGKIVASTVTKVLHRTKGRMRTLYAPLVRYSYRVDGETYENHRIVYGFRRRAGHAAAAEKVCKRYPTGREVEVAYPPSAPQKSILAPVSIQASTWVLSALAIWALFVCGWFAVAIAAR